MNKQSITLNKQNKQNSRFKLNLRSFRILITVVVAVFSMNVLVFATTTTPNPTEAELQRLREDNQRLQSIVNDLNSQLQSTPEPTAKPLAPPKMQLTSPSITKMKPGERNDIELAFKNIGQSYAKEISWIISPSGDAPLTIAPPEKSSGYVYEGQTKKLNLNVKVDNKAKAGAYVVTASLTYKSDTEELVTSDHTFTIKVEAEDTAPEIFIPSFSLGTKQPKAGENFILTAMIQNSGDGIGKDVQVTLDGLDSTKIYLSNTANNIYYKDFPANSQKAAVFEFTVAKNLKSGSYPLSFKVKYKDEANTVLEDTYTYYVNVSSAGASSEVKSALELVDVTAPTGVFGVGQEFVVTMGLKNTSTVATKNIKITATADAEGGVVPKSANIKAIPILEAGKTVPNTFKFAPTAKAKSQNYVISFKVEYETGIEGEESKPEVAFFEQYVGVNVTNAKADEEKPDEKDAKYSKPKIRIYSYQIEPSIVKAGTEFDLTMVFENTHSTKTIGNIKAVLTPNETNDKKGSIFMPSEGSNTFFIDSIPPKSTSEKKFKMFVIPDADPRTYTITVNFKYQDEEFNDYEESETIGVPVKQITKLDTGNISTPTEGFLDSPININFSLMNTGKAALNNLTVKIEGDFDTSQSFMYFGTLNKSSSSYYDAEITPKTPGEQKGVVLITYEDDTGEVTEIKRDFVINIQDSAPIDQGGMTEPAPMPEQPKSLVDQAIGIAQNPFVWAGVAAFIVIIVVFRVLYLKRKRSMVFDE